jgi:YD repeat-containing protein
MYSENIHLSTHSPFSNQHKLEYTAHHHQISRRMRWVGPVACMGEGRGVYRVLVGRPKGKRPVGRPRCRWEDNIKMDLKESGIDGANWIQLAQDGVQWQAFVNMVMNSVP